MLSIGNQKCDNVDDADADMIPLCQPCFAGDTKRSYLRVESLKISSSPVERSDLRFFLDGFLRKASDPLFDSSDLCLLMSTSNWFAS